MDELCKKKPIVLAVVGATASGKTSLSVALAKAVQGEIISVDSMQIYKELSIGTAKVTQQEADGVPHHAVDIRQPSDIFSVADFTALASACTADITARGKIPVLAGGTGQYLESFLKGMQFSEAKTQSGLRARLAAELAEQGAQAMYDRLEALDAQAAHATHPNNTVRVLRALEHYYTTGQTISQQKADSLPPEAPYRSLVIGLDYPERAVLYERINRRVDIMLEQGLLQEAALVYANRASYVTAAQAIGYKEFFPYFEGEAGVEDCAEKLKQASRKYAKRQLTWFRHMKDIHWIDASAPDATTQAIAVATAFLQKEGAL